jgi:hypothetical protein
VGNIGSIGGEFRSGGSVLLDGGELRAAFGVAIAISTALPLAARTATSLDCIKTLNDKLERAAIVTQKL